MKTINHLLTATIISGVFAFGLTVNATQNSKEILTKQVIAVKSQTVKKIKTFRRILPKL